MDEKYRHELKYVIDERSMTVISERLKDICDLDYHVGKSGRYQIRSVYFDDYKNSFYYENEHGESMRYKYRIRIYNHSEQRISLEKKSKKSGMTSKKSVNMTREMVDSILNDTFSMELIEKADNIFLKEFLLKREIMLLKPAIIVQYERIPFIYNDGNVRITLDENISGSKDFAHFFDEELYTYPIMQSGKHVLEIKYDEFLPSILQKQLNLGDLKRNSYSKYYLCRRLTK